MSRYRCPTCGHEQEMAEYDLPWARCHKTGQSVVMQPVEPQTIPETKQ